MSPEAMGRVLVVDDDEWIIDGARTVLEARGFNVLSAPDGARGLEIARESSPDVVITDILMPEMDGWQFVRQLRAEPQFALTPVLFLTSKGGADDRIAGFQLGADDYLGKPVNLPELPRRVMKALAQRRQLERDLSTPTVPSQAGGGIKGSMDQIGVASLLSVLGSGRRSGILRLSGLLAEGELLIYLVRGEIYRVEAQGRGRLTIEEVYDQLFRALEGEFTFLPMRLRISNELALSVERLLFHVARQSFQAKCA